MAYCTKCGQALASGDKFCAHCGAETGLPAQQADVSIESTEKLAVDDKGQDALIYRGVPLRFLAQLIDAIPMLIIYFILGSLVADISGTGKTADGFELEGGPAAILLAMTIVAGILYFSLLEAWWSGQTFGKKLTGIQVTNLQGERIGFGQALQRNIWRVVDGLFFYLVGALLIWRSPTKQRLGDRLAHTVVIKKRKRPKENHPGSKGKVKKTRLSFGSRDVGIIDLD